MGVVVVAPDKFRGTLTATAAAVAISKAVASVGGVPRSFPMSDGGEGLIEVLCDEVNSRVVDGPLGVKVLASWGVSHGVGIDVAVIEMAQASGLGLVGGAQGNNSVLATTTGTGQLIAGAIDDGFTKILIGCGGSATTDGGLGAVELLRSHPRLWEVELVALTDVRTRFEDAARGFGPQKGASIAQIKVLEERLVELRTRYKTIFAKDVGDLEGSGAAGGLAGGLAALGAKIEPGARYVMREVGISEEVSKADLVVTGEGKLDAESFNGKVVGEMIKLAVAAKKPVLVIVGIADPEGTELATSQGAHVIDLSATFDPWRSSNNTAEMVERATSEFLRNASK